jgi:hypothetical protein
LRQGGKADHLSGSATGSLSKKQARLIKYQLIIAKLPLAKDLADFQVAKTPISLGLPDPPVGARRVVGGPESGASGSVYGGAYSAAIWLVSVLAGRRSAGFRGEYG